MSHILFPSHELPPYLSVLIGILSLATKAITGPMFSGNIVWYEALAPGLYIFCACAVSLEPIFLSLRKGKKYLHRVS